VFPAELPPLPSESLLSMEEPLGGGGGGNRLCNHLRNPTAATESNPRLWFLFHPCLIKLPSRCQKQAHNEGIRFATALKTEFFAGQRWGSIFSDRGHASPADPIEPNMVFLVGSRTQRSFCISAAFVVIAEGAHVFVDWFLRCP